MMDPTRDLERVVGAVIRILPRRVEFCWQSSVVQIVRCDRIFAVRMIIFTRRAEPLRVASSVTSKALGCFTEWHLSWFARMYTSTFLLNRWDFSIRFIKDCRTRIWNSIVSISREGFFYS